MSNIMELPVIDPRTQAMTKTDQVALLRTIEALVKMLPQETKDRMLWEAADLVRRKRDKQSPYAHIGFTYCIYMTRAAVERAPGKTM